MKKIGIVVGLLLVITGAYFVWHKNNHAEKANDTVRVENKAEYSVVYQESGTVTVVEGEQKTELNEVTREKKVQNGTKVTTGPKSYAYVIFPDNSMMSLDANTEVTINFAQGNTSVIQTLGNTYHRVKKLQSDASYEVKTAGTLAAVRGTKFAVELDAKTKKSKIKVTESVVQVYKLPENQDLANIDIETMDINIPSVLVNVDTKIEVAPTESLPTQASAFARTERNDGAWMEKNDKVDTFFDSVEGDSQKVIERMRELRKEVSEQTKNTEGSEQVFMQRLRTLKENPITVPVVPPQSPIEKLPVEDVKEVLQEIKQVSRDEFENIFEGVYAKLFPITADKKQFCASIASTDASQIRSAIAIVEKTYGQQIPNKEEMFAFLTQAKTFCASNETLMDTIEEAYTEKYPF